MLQGSDKAAALLLSIDPEIARRLLRHFDQDDLHQLAKRAAALGVVGGEALESLIGDFSDQFFSRTPDLIGAPEKAEQLLTGVIPPENVAEIMSDVIGGSNQFFWQRLSSLPINAIGSYLANEHPQTIALVMGRLDYNCGGGFGRTPWAIAEQRHQSNVEISPGNGHRDPNN